LRKQARQRFGVVEENEEQLNQVTAGPSNPDVRYELVFRNGACVSVPVIEEAKNVVQFSASGHINFFNDLEEGKQVEGVTNKEHEQEKKAEQEEYEKKIGLLTYLGQGSAEATGEVSWWEKPSLIKSLKDKEADDVKIEKSREMQDPLRVIQRYLGHDESQKRAKKVQKSSGNLNFTSQKITSNEITPSIKLKSKKDKKKHKKNKRDKHQNKSRKRKYSESDNSDSRSSVKRSRKSSPTSHSSSTDSSDSEAEKKKKLAVLRAKRLQREKEEKAKARKLLGIVDKASSPQKEETAEKQVTSIQQKYYSQYCPDVARQNKPLDSSTKYWLQ
jgi:hypothetical protein